jgi:hypothetical protein
MVGKEHPYYGSFYRHMIKRAKKLGLSCDFITTIESFNIWFKAIGLIPEGMEHPTVGRKDHSKGYVIENGEPNFAWQEKSDNSREMSLRTYTYENRSRAGREGVKAQMDAGTHITQTGKSAFHTGEAQRISAKGPNHINKRVRTCPHCGLTGKGPNMSRYHFDKCRSVL